MTRSTEPRKFSYGNETRARAYVESLIARGPQTGPVYLVVSPKLRMNERIWPNLLRNLRELLPGVTFRLWPQIMKNAEESGGSRVDYIRDNHAGCVLIGFRHHHMLKIGPVALAEATAFAASGKPALVFTGSRLAAWPDCEVLKIPEESRRDRFVAAYVLLPLRPASIPLPTFAASLHMWAIRDPEVIARAAGLGSERPAAGSRKPGRAVPPVRFVTGARTRTEVR